MTWSRELVPGQLVRLTADCFPTRLGLVVAVIVAPHYGYKSNVKKAVIYALPDKNAYSSIAKEATIYSFPDHPREIDVQVIRGV